MLKICMVIPKGLPVPNVKGGAIETLVTEIVKHNEKEKKLDLTVFSMYDEIAQHESEKYKYTKFCYIKNNLYYKIFAVITRIRKIFKKDLNTYNEIIL